MIVKQSLSKVIAPSKLGSGCVILISFYHMMFFDFVEVLSANDSYSPFIRSLESTNIPLPNRRVHKDLDTLKASIHLLVDPSK